MILSLPLRILVSVQLLVEVLTSTSLTDEERFVDSVADLLGVSFVVISAETNSRICFLNVSPDEVIRSLFYNKNNDSLITVSVYASDNFSSLKCRSTKIE